MISAFDVKQYAKNHPESWFAINENNEVIDKENNAVVCNIKTLVQVLREKLHCDFEVIYECHGTLDIVYRCKQCGTVIFASDDEWYYEPGLCCPVCSDYKTGFEYWSGEDIKNDPEKQKYIEFLNEMEREQEESYQRYKKRGKYDSEIWKGRIRLPHGLAIYIDLRCDNLFKHYLRGLHIELHLARKDDDSFGYVFVHRMVIPLSVSALRISLHSLRRYCNGRHYSHRAGGNLAVLSEKQEAPEKRDGAHSRE